MIKLTGIAFVPIDIDLTHFNGYSLTIFYLKWEYKGKVCLLGNGKSLLHIGITHSNNSSLYFVLIVFGIRVIKYYIRPEKIRVCKHCKKKVEVDSYADGTTDYWCDEHQDINECDTEIIEVRPKE